MVDIATLGFKVGTGDLVKAQNALEALPPAAQAAETAANEVSAALDAIAEAGKKVVTTTTATTKVIDGVSASANKAAANTNKYVKSLDELSAVQKRINALTGADKGQFSNIGRAADIEAYGAALDDLRAKYNPLFAASRTYKQTLLDINAAAKVGAISEKERVAAINNTKSAFAQQVTSLKQVQSANDKAGKSIEGLSWQAKNLSFQLVDITQGIASGVPLFQIFAQQAGQVGQALASAQPGQNLFKEIGKTIAGFLTPMRLAVAGVVGLAAGLTMLALNTLSNAKAMDELSRSTDESVKRLRALQQATAIKGMSFDEFAQGMQSFSKAVFDARNNAGELRGLMIANGESARTQSEYFNKVADMVARTASGIQKRNILEAAGLPTTQKWVDFMSQGSRGIEAVTAATVTFNDEAEKNLVKKAKEFDVAWNTAINNFSNLIKSATIDMIGFFEKAKPYLDALSKIRGIQGAMTAGGKGASAGGETASNGFADRFGGDGKNPAASNSALAKALNDRALALANVGKEEVKTREQLMLSNSQAQQRLSLLGDMATVEDRVKQKRLELDAANLQSVGVSERMEKAILNNVRAQEQMNRVQQQAQMGIFSLKAAQEAANNTLQSWIDKGLVDKNNTEQMAAARNVLNRSIEQTGEAAQVAASKFPQFTQSMIDAGNVGKQVDQALTTSFNGLVTPIQDLANGATSLGGAFNSAKSIIVKALQEVIIKLLIIKPLMAMFGGGEGIGGFLTTLLGGGTKSAKGNVFANDNHVKGYAKGGVFTNQVITKPTMFANGGKLNKMGEAGPEAVMPLRRGPNGSLGVQMYGGNRGGGGVSIADNSTYVIGGNVTQEDIANLRKENDRKLERQKKQALADIADARRRGAKV